MNESGRAEMSESKDCTAWLVNEEHSSLFVEGWVKMHFRIMTAPQERLSLHLTDHVSGLPPME